MSRKQITWHYDESEIKINKFNLITQIPPAIDPIAYSEELLSGYVFGSGIYIDNSLVRSDINGYTIKFKIGELTNGFLDNVFVINNTELETTVNGISITNINNVQPDIFFLKIAGTESNQRIEFYALPNINSLEKDWVHYENLSSNLSVSFSSAKPLTTHIVISVNPTGDTDEVGFNILIDPEAWSAPLVNLVEFPGDPLKIYENINNLSKLLDVDELIFNGDKYNYDYSSSNYNPETNTYSLNDDLVQFNNSEVFKKLLISQFLPEYDNFFKEVDFISESIQEESAKIAFKEKSKALLSILLKKIALMNMFKGTKKEIEFILSIFANLVGKTIVSVDAYPYRNFVYMVTSDVEQSVWLRDVKQIVHPCGWGSIYIEIPSEDKDYFDYNIPSIEKYEDAFLEKMSYLSFGGRTEFIPFFLSVACGDLTSERAFDFTNGGDARDDDSEYSLDDAIAGITNGDIDQVLGYNTRLICRSTSDVEIGPLVSEITLTLPAGLSFTASEPLAIVFNDLNKFLGLVTSYNTISGELVIGGNSYGEGIFSNWDIYAIDTNSTITYPLTGIATEYEWDLFHGNVYSKTINTGANYVEITPQDGDSIILTLRNENWAYTYPPIQNIWGN